MPITKAQMCYFRDPFNMNGFFLWQTAGQEETMKAVITVVGKDRKGIIAKVATVLAESGANIDDISQTIMHGIFTMVMLVDLGSLDVSFGELQGSLQACALELGMEIRMQREEVFTAMHQV